MNGTHSAVVTLTLARVVSVTVTDDTLSVDLEDGRTIAVPIGWYPRLAHGTIAERANFQISGGLTPTDSILGADQKSVVLTLSGVVPPSTTITINGVKDLSGNVIAANTIVGVTILPISAGDIGVVNVPRSVSPSIVMLWTFFCAN